MSSLYSSFNASISGLSANATRLSAISDNIANTGTAGYKRIATSFYSLVTGSGLPGAPFVAGGVRAQTLRLIGESGALSRSSNPTDLAVRGRGFLPVTSMLAVQSGDAQLPLFLATTGSFRPDAQGILRTEAGHVLLGLPANPDGTVPPFPRDTATALQPIRIVTTRFESEPTTLVTLAVNLPSTATRAGASGASHDMRVDYFTSLGMTESVEITFEPIVPEDGQSNQWIMRLTDPREGGAVVGEYLLTFGNTPPEAGRLVAVDFADPDDPRGLAYDPETGRLAVTLDGREIAFEIGRLGEPGGLTQMGETFLPTRIERDGAPVHNLVGVQVEPDGTVRAYYDSGINRVIAQIPLVDVPNPNGLETLDGQIYRITAASGPMFLWDAGEGPTGSILGFSLEESTTDVAAELTSLIQTQRAYSSNAKVIQTVDEMLQETSNIKR